MEKLRSMRLLKGMRPLILITGKRNSDIYDFSFKCPGKMVERMFIVTSSPNKLIPSTFRTNWKLVDRKLCICFFRFFFYGKRRVKNPVWFIYELREYSERMFPYSYGQVGSTANLIFIEMHSLTPNLLIKRARERGSKKALRKPPVVGE